MQRFFKVEDRTLKRHNSIGVFVVYIHTGNSMQINPSKSRDLVDENNKILTEWKWFETTVLSIDNHFLWDIWFQGLLSVYQKNKNNSPYPDIDGTFLINIHHI